MFFHILTVATGPGDLRQISEKYPEPMRKQLLMYLWYYSRDYAVFLTLWGTQKKLSTYIVKIYW